MHLILGNTATLNDGKAMPTPSFCTSTKLFWLEADLLMAREPYSLIAPRPNWKMWCKTHGFTNLYLFALETELGVFIRKRDLTTKLNGTQTLILNYSFDRKLKDSGCENWSIYLHNRTSRSGCRKLDCSLFKRTRLNLFPLPWTGNGAFVFLCFFASSLQFTLLFWAKMQLDWSSRLLDFL